jgi:iron complex transport system permease protein
VADVIGRLVLRPSELEVSVVTAVLGAPVFIAIVRRRRLAQL